MGYLDSDGLASLWTKIKALVGNYLPLTGGTISGELEISGGLTGTPTAPTANSGTNTTQIATTAFVQDAISDMDADTLGGYSESAFVHNISASGKDISSASYTSAYITTIANSSSTPSTSWWHILHLPHSHGNGYGAQIAVPFSQSTDCYVRSSTGTSWGSWVKLLTAKDKSTNVASSFGMREIAMSTTALTTGETELSQGTIYIQYE